MKARSRSFAWFLCAVLVSNLAGSAFVASAAWLVGSPTLPAWLPFANQAVAVGAVVLGSVGGTWLARRVDFGVGVAVASVVEALLALAPVAAVMIVGEAAESVLAVVVVVGNGLVALASGVTGPLWIAAIHAWPNAGDDSTSRIAREAAVYQVAKVAGPVVAGAVLGRAGNSSSLIVFGALNSVSFLAVAGAILYVARKFTFGRDLGLPVHERGRVRPRQLTRTAFLIGTLALAFDATRAFLPRLLQEEGMVASAGGVVLACTAAGAAVSGLGVRFLQNAAFANVLTFAGFMLVLAALVVWSIGGPIGFWLAGGFVGGLGMSVAYSLVVSDSLRGAPRPAGISAQIRVAKTVSGLLGTGLIAGCVALSLPILLAPLIGAAAGGFVAWRSRARLSGS